MASMMAGTASKVRDLPRPTGKAALYQLTPPLGGHEYVIASAIVIEGTLGLTGPETLVFPANENGAATSLREIAGGRGYLSHERALNEAGYTISA